MEYRAPRACPVCGQPLAVTRLSCQHCHSTLEGEFAPCRFCQLREEQQRFIEVFIKCRGNIKEVEKELEISYPTVRSRLDEVIIALGYQMDKKARQEEEERLEILAALEKGEITPQEAAKRLTRARKSHR
ncbi:MAG: DUF2089 domain-containing protein [Firmicutes bacterium]|nr:DUF2089 domain-containing protein [Bacillota bacterium]